MQQLSDPRERQFLEAAERGDRPTMVRLLSDQEPPLNVNCTDMLGRSALLIAVDNENAEIVEMLLKYEAVITGGFWGLERSRGSTKRHTKGDSRGRGTSREACSVARRVMVAA